MPADTEKVSFLDESEWPSSWIDERRLTLIFQPKIEELFGVGVVIQEEWLKSPRNRLAIVSGISDFDFDDRPWWSDLWDPVIYPWPKVQPWRGNEIKLSESNDAVELGMQNYSRETKISASYRLGHGIFEFLKRRLEEYSPAVTGADRILLGCGFALPEGNIPRSRPITWPQKIPDPIHLTAAPRRMSFEIAGVFNAEPDWTKRRLETLSRWMAAMN